MFSSYLPDHTYLELNNVKVSPMIVQNIISTKGIKQKIATSLI